MFSPSALPSPPHFAQLLSLLPAMPDGALDTAVRADEVGSQEDLYDDLHSSSHHYSHSGGGGEQLAINELHASCCVFALPTEAEEIRENPHSGKTGSHPSSSSFAFPMREES
ncbi:hypothetical protein P7K49_014436 [Saguinus oedipus]|uniref:Uncharacterized protein n=1 Tax=Saguinus oedipus TaxID=9490 RepID=A0ABQ9VIS1_SAGOE|nr:hypothetical protein P7K49_014436 [Saguinus oedipus]